MIELATAAFNIVAAACCICLMGPDVGGLPAALLLGSASIQLLNFRRDRRLARAGGAGAEQRSAQVPKQPMPSQPKRVRAVQTK